MVRSWLARGLSRPARSSAIVLSIGMSASLGELSAYAQAGAVGTIRVEGNKRVEPETVRTYLTFNVGDPYDLAKVDEFAKGSICHRLVPGRSHPARRQPVVIVVVENPIVSRVAFEGNKEVEDDALTAEVQLKPRTVYTRARVQADVQRILDVYRRQGLYAAQVDPKIIKLETTASTSCSRSMRDRPPRSAPSTSSATPPSAILSFAT
jgi:outer membrane protein insertion porin family